ncbi:MAG TPA: 16S rRNA (adenine(1518)-N(6)/adenine(1519)-N(6))-dimethyltransferase RsmA [Acidobacteriaceae bacterium]|nr:16S rRNA (adenine(1518)-N(6)/adenine(1519)-N(6))-dimethyltransferase RsmA [Acidobacteriaceae bacterium]
MPPGNPKRPKLGQNFLVSPSAQTAIADALGDVAHRTVVEIGPGRGAITAILAARAHRLIAIELDRELAPRLREQFADRLGVSIFEQDILTADFASLRGAGEDKLLVVGNLPYYITSDILLHLFAAHQHIDRAVLMIQREVADRVAASPGTRDYGLLSATTQLYARVEKLFTLPPGAFSPPPQVHSTVLRLTMSPRFAELGLVPTPDRPDPASGFIAFLRIGFAQKRKMLAKNLRTAGYDADAITSAFQGCGIPPQSRAEQLELPAMACLFHTLTNR